MKDTATIVNMEDMEVAGKRVMVRCDLDAPVEKGRILDDARIRRWLPTVERLVERSARVIVMGHLGAPGGKVNGKLSVEPVAMRLAELLSVGEVVLTDSCVGGGAKRVSLDLRDGEVAVLENLGFHVGEASNDEKFARELAGLGELYVGDDFRALRETRASTVGVARHLDKRAAGPQVHRELTAVERFVRHQVERPLVAVVGGDDLKGRLPLIQHLLETVDTLVFGGGVGNAFVAASRGPLGDTPVDSGKLPLCRDVLAKAVTAGKRLLLPMDFTIAAPEGEDVQNARCDQIPTGMVIWDIGTESRSAFRDVIKRAGTVLWVGTLGQTRRSPFAEGSLAVAKAIAGSAAYSAVYGEEAVRIVETSGLEKGFSHISAGEDTAVALLQGNTLPAVEALRKSR